MIDLNDIRTSVNNGQTIAEALESQISTKCSLQGYGVTTQTSSNGIVKIDFGSAIKVTESDLPHFTIDYEKWFQQNPNAIIPDDLDGKGFHAYCQGCKSNWFNFIFQNGLDIPDSPNPETLNDANRTKIFYIYIDVSNVTDAKSLVEAIYNQGELVANPGSYCCQSIAHNIYLAMNPDDATLTVYDYRPNYPSSYGGMAVAAGVYGTTERNYEPYERTLVIQDTEKSNSYVTIHIPEMTLDSIFSKLRPKKIQDYPVTSERAIEQLLGRGRDQALSNPAGTSKCGILDQGIDYVIGAITTIGAEMQRLETSNANIKTKSENAIASESTIRDADMAKEMVAFTKSNILSQAAQAMLAQGNQNLAHVIDLLR